MKRPDGCLIIAEAGVNHNGDLQLAYKLVDEASKSGANAVKFQTFNPDALVAKSSTRAPYQQLAGDSPQHEMLSGLQLTYNEQALIKQYCDRIGIEFISTAYDEEAVDFLKALGVSRIKIASADIINLPLLESVCKSGLPIIQSTGMATLQEVDRTYRFLQESGSPDISLLHCVTSYPLDIDQVNMNWLTILQKRFECAIGYSDHTLGTTIPLMAVSMGATILEKHFTLDRSMQGPDHNASLEPKDFKKMVSSIRDLEQAFGNTNFGVTDQEKENIIPMRRSLHAARKIERGQTIRQDDIAVLRPYTGIDPWSIKMVIGSTAKIDIELGTPITWNAI